RDHTTGAATTWLVVNAPAATVPGSPTTRARSGAPDGLSPQATPAAPNPGAAATPSRRSTPAPPAGRPAPPPTPLTAPGARGRARPSRAAPGPGWRTGRPAPRPPCPRFPL